MKKYIDELLGALLLVFIIGNTVFSGCIVAPLAIGMTVTAMAFALGGNFGGAFNPAGATAMGLIRGGNLWIYLIACPLGGIVAAQLFKQLTADGD